MPNLTTTTLSEIPPTSTVNTKEEVHGLRPRIGYHDPVRIPTSFWHKQNLLIPTPTATRDIKSTLIPSTEIRPAPTRQVRLQTI